MRKKQDDKLKEVIGEEEKKQEPEQKVQNLNGQIPS